MEVWEWWIWKSDRENKYAHFKWGVFLNSRYAWHWNWAPDDLYFLSYLKKTVVGIWIPLMMSIGLSVELSLDIPLANLCTEMNVYILKNFGKEWLRKCSFYEFLKGFRSPFRNNFWFFCFEFFSEIKTKYFGNFEFLVSWTKTYNFSQITWLFFFNFYE